MVLPEAFYALIFVPGRESCLNSALVVALWSIAYVASDIFLVNRLHQTRHTLCVRGILLL